MLYFYLGITVVVAFLIGYRWAEVEGNRLLQKEYGYTLYWMGLANSLKEKGNRKS